MRDAGIPNETLTVNEPIIDFAFEPPVPSYLVPNSPPRFAFIYSGKGGKSLDVSIYSLLAVRGGDKIVKITTLENKQCNRLVWCPVGTVLLLAGTGDINGQFELYDADENAKLASFEHFMCTDIAWDPSGRFLCTAATQPMFGEVAVRFTLENGYRLWNGIGQRLREVSHSDFYQFLWRPRPALRLSDAELEDIRKKLPQHIKRFEKEDTLLKRRRQAAQDQKRVQELEEFRSMVEQHRAIVQEQMAKRRAMGIHWVVPVVWGEESGPGNAPAAGAAAGKGGEEEEQMEIVETVEEIVSEKIERLDG
jgi:translation initiation factor 3 subunit B